MFWPYQLAFVTVEGCDSTNISLGMKIYALLQDMFYFLGFLHAEWKCRRGSLLFVRNNEISVALQFEVAMTTSGGRAKFVESMEGIVKGVKQVQLISFRIS